VERLWGTRGSIMPNGQGRLAGAKIQDPYIPGVGDVKIPTDASTLYQLGGMDAAGNNRANQAPQAKEATPTIPDLSQSSIGRTPGSNFGMPPSTVGGAGSRARGGY
jgi:hypothetical protein